ncbi:ABC transporter ATP-binding protein [Enterococcus sp. DIV0187]|uniref:ABC transporter ATP-binding protein n=1 Tax=Enterococcus sp. DIV0187 TaxID=2774644 RepID=UPI003F26104F
MRALIQVKKVVKNYGSGENITRALDQVDFEIKSGEFTGIMGASGSGKSTLLNVLSTIDTVTGGQVYFDGTDISTLDEVEVAAFRKKNIGFVFQDFNLLDTLTIEENITLAMSLQNHSKDKIIRRVDQLLSELGIEKIRNKFPYEVSGGQKQRCACARAIANKPMVIMADEPTGALDSKSAQMLLETFVTMNEKLLSTILMVTHDAFSASYCKRILFLKDGQISHELIRGERSRRDFLNSILDVLAVFGGGGSRV